MHIHTSACRVLRDSTDKRVGLRMSTECGAKEDKDDYCTFHDKELFAVLQDIKG